LLHAGRDDANTGLNCSPPQVFKKGDLTYSPGSP